MEAFKGSYKYAEEMARLALQDRTAQEQELEALKNKATSPTKQSENTKLSKQKTPVKQAAAKDSDISDLTENWKCCEPNEFSFVPCGKRNVIETSTCERCGHWQCDTCAVTLDPNAPPKEYPKPRDPETGLVRRASVSLKRAGSILSRNDPNSKTPSSKGKEVVRSQAIAEGNENENENNKGVGVTLEDVGSTGTNLVRRASTSIKNAASVLGGRRRRSADPKLGGVSSPEKSKLSEEIKVEVVPNTQQHIFIKVAEIPECGGRMVCNPNYTGQV